MITIYGINNCDTMKRAMAWLDAHGIVYRFHDFKRSGIDRATLDSWEAELGWERLLNRRGMLWRRVTDPVKSAIDRDSALALMLENPGIIKRPLLDTGHARHLGFSPDGYREILR
jgi:Spx/MgsR family transcriptional regulator